MSVMLRRMLYLVAVLGVAMPRPLHGACFDTLPADRIGWARACGAVGAAELLYMAFGSDNLGNYP